jgi:hypothetical protein
MSTIDAKTRRALRGIITGKIDPMTFVSVQKWVSSCYNRPSLAELKLEACNEILSGYGVEAIRGGYWDSYHGDVVFTYVNMGDPYIQTVVFDCHKGTFHLTSWGDMVEHAPKYYGIY